MEDEKMQVDQKKIIVAHESFCFIAEWRGVHAIITLKAAEMLTYHLVV